MANDLGLALARQWAMLQGMPRSPRKITATELEALLRADGFDVSKRTIERDLHTLSARFPLILDDRSRPYGWSWAKGAQFEFMPTLTSPQAVALLLAQSHLSGLLPQAMSKTLTPIFDAASKALASSGWKDWHRKTAVVPMGLALMSPKISPNVLDVVQSALVRRRCVTVLYRPKGGEQYKTRKLHPLGLLSRGPVLYLVCTMDDHEDVRQLALHRMTKPREMDVKARVPVGFDFQHWVRTEARHYNANGTIYLVARFDAGAAEHLREMPISNNQVLRDLKGGDRVELRATVENDQLLRWWLLGFGSLVEVLAPAPLRAWFAGEAAALDRQYA